MTKKLGALHWASISNEHAGSSQGFIEVPFSSPATDAQGIATVLVRRVAEAALGLAAAEHLNDTDVVLEGVSAVLADVSAARLSRLCFVLGHVGLQHLVRARAGLRARTE